MKFLITGDWHLDEKKPKNRKEGYVQEQKDKTVWIFKRGKKEKVSAILQPGDFCNTSKLSDGFKSIWINWLKLFGMPIITIPGQHDMRYHSSDILNTPIGVLWSAEVIHVASDNALSIEDEVDIYGSGWEEDIPDINRPNACNILLIHKMVSDVALWPGHVFTTPKWLMENTDYDLIVCGDNHKSFLHSAPSPRGDRWVINCGSLMRSAIDQKDHEPIIYIYDTETREPEPILIPVKPFKEVMNIEEAEKEKEQNEELENFVKGLSDTNIEGLDFKKNLIEYLNKNKNEIGQGVIDIINEIVGGQI